MATKHVAFFRVKETGNPDFKAWEEDNVLQFPEEILNPEQACRDLIEWFNKGRRSHETEREFVELLRVEEIEEKPEIFLDYDNEEDFIFDDDDDY